MLKLHGILLLQVTINTERNKQTNLNLDNNNTDSQYHKFIRLFVSRIHGFEALMAVQSIDHKDIYFFRWSKI